MTYKISISMEEVLDMPMARRGVVTESKNVSGNSARNRMSATGEDTNEMRHLL